MGESLMQRRRVSEEVFRYVKLYQQGSAVPYNWFLPVIHKFELIEVVND